MKTQHSKSKNAPGRRTLARAVLGIGLSACLGGVILAAQGGPTTPPAAPAMPGMTMPAGASGSQAGAGTPALVSAAPLLKASQTLSMSVPYTPDTRLPDDYRCFVLDPRLTSDRSLTGYEVRPGNAGVVHHIILYVATPDQLQSVADKNGKDGQPGWSCFGGSGLRGKSGVNAAAAALALAGGTVGSDLVEQAASSMGGLGIGSWTPGSTATLFPDGTGRVIPRGSLLVMQVHYNTLLARKPDLTSVDLQYADTGVSLQPLRNITVAAPVELPCPVAQSGTAQPQAAQPQTAQAQTVQAQAACTRTAALQANADRYGQRSAMLPQVLLRLCKHTPGDYEQQNPAHVTSTCDITVSHDATAYGATLHMHTRGVSTSLTLNPDTAKEQTLLDIPAWDFHWQGSYWYQQPISLRQGDRLRLSCTWNNAGPDARYVVWGEGTQDEMCLGSLTVTQ